MNTEYENAPPRADAMIASMRAIGYDLSMAIADLIDNSIFAKAKNITIKYHWAGPDSWIYILDDGTGMTEEKLKEAMILGSRSPNEERSLSDLGRFGLGLKTASFSQCKILTVHTKTPVGEISTRCWDLDHVEHSKKWELGKKAPPGAARIISDIENVPHGTIVLWQGLDKVVGGHDSDDENAMNIYYEKFLAVREYLEMVLHRYISPPFNLSITLGKDKLKPWDPYLKSNQFTQELSNEKFDDGTVKVIPYVLPHISKRSSSENNTGAGPKGWNAQQGFYLYRNRRMIVPGGYLDLNIKPEEHYKLARIMVDINNRMDKEWGIDVRKATAKPPDRLRSQIEKVAKATRNEAVKIYRARTGTPRKISGRKEQDVWHRKRMGDKIVYRINRENVVIKRILDELNPPASLIRKLFHVIETTIPHRLIIMDNSDHEDCHVDLPSEINMPSEGLIELCKELYNNHRKKNKTHEEVVDIVLSIEPFNTHPAYRAALDSMIEGK